MGDLCTVQLLSMIFLSNLILSIIFRIAPADASTTGTDASCTTDYIEVYKYIGSGFLNENLKK